MSFTGGQGQARAERHRESRKADDTAANSASPLGLFMSTPSSSIDSRDVNQSVKVDIFESGVCSPSAVPLHARDSRSSGTQQIDMAQTVPEKEKRQVSVNIDMTESNTHTPTLTELQEEAQKTDLYGVGGDGGADLGKADSDDAEQMEHADCTCSDSDHNEEDSSEQCVGGIPMKDLLARFHRWERILDDKLGKQSTDTG